jgi:hypothetical protein
MIEQVKIGESIDVYREKPCVTRVFGGFYGEIE